MTALRRTEADLWTIGGVWPGILPLLFCFIGLALWSGQFRDLPAAEIYVRRGQDHGCYYELREPAWLKGDPLSHHLMLVSNCELFFTDIPEGAAHRFWGKRIAFVLQPKSSPAARRGLGKAVLATGQR